MNQCYPCGNMPSEKPVKDGVTVKEPAFYLVGGKVVALTETATVKDGEVSRSWVDGSGKVYAADESGYKPDLPQGSMALNKKQIVGVGGGASAADVVGELLDNADLLRQLAAALFAVLAKEEVVGLGGTSHGWTVEKPSKPNVA